MSHKTPSRSTAFVLAVLLGLSVLIAGAAIAAPSVGTNSELADGDTITDFNASPNVNHTISVVALNGTAPTAEISLNDSQSDADGVVFHSIGQADWTNETSGTPPAAGTTWNASVAQSDLADVPMEPGENVTVDVTVWDNATSTAANTTFQVTLDNTDERHVVYAGDTAASTGDLLEVNDVENTLFDTEISVFGILGADDFSKVDADSLAVNGSETDVVVILGNSSAADDYSSTFDDASSGDWVRSSVAFVEGEPVLTFDSEAGDAVDDAETHAVYESDVGGQSAIVFDLGDDHSDASAVDVESFSTTGWAMQFQTYWREITGLSGILGSTLWFVFRPRRRDES